MVEEFLDFALHGLQNRQCVFGSGAGIGQEEAGIDERLQKAVHAVNQAFVLADLLIQTRGHAAAQEVIDDVEIENDALIRRNMTENQRADALARSGVRQILRLCAGAAPAV